MAGKDKVYIDIIVDDKGTTKRVAVDSKKLGVALDDVEKSQKRTGKSAKDADRNLKGLSKQSSNTTKNFSKMAQGMTGTLVPAYAILASNVFAITAAFQFLKKAADFRVIQESQVAFTGATGVGMRTLTADIQAASGAMLDFQTSSEAAAIGIASGLGSGQITELAEGAGNLSKILGRDVTDSFNRLIRGVTKAEPELLDELGITLRLADAQTNYAATLGKSAKDLSNYEKKQAVFAEVQGQLEDKYNAVAKATDVQANSVARLGVAFDKVMKPIKSFISAIAEPTAEFFIKNIGSLTAALALLAIPILKSIIPGTNEWAQASKDAADDASQAYKDAREEMERMEQAQKDLEASGKEADFTVEGAKKGSGIDILATDGEQALKSDKYAKNRIDLMLAHAKQGNGAIRKMDKRTGKMYILTLKRMQRGSATFFEKIAMGWHKTARAASVAAKQVEVVWKKAMAGAKKAVAGFTKFADRAFRLAGWIGMLMMAYDLLKEAANALGFFKPNPAVEKLKGQFEELGEALEIVEEEYKKFAQIQDVLAEAQKRTGEGDPLGLLKAQGNFFAGITKPMAAAANQLLAYKEGNFEAALGVKKLTDEERKAMKDRLKTLEIMEKGGSNVGFLAKLAGHGDKRSDEEKEEQKDLAATLAEQEGLGDTSKMTDKLSEANEKLSSSQIVAARTALSYLDDLKNLTDEQREYKAIVSLLAEGKVIDQKSIDRLTELADGFEEAGKQAAFAEEQNKEIETSYSALLAGITTYKTSVTDLTDKIKDQSKAYQKTLDEQIAQLSEENVAWLKKEIKNLEDKEKVLNRIRDLEIGMANKRLQLQISFTKALAGATPLQQKSLGVQQKLLEIDLKREEINAHMALATKDLENIDSAKVTSYELQLLLLEEQEAALERQLDLSSQLRDTAAADLEGGIQGGLAGILKGEQSVKEAAIGIAKGVAEGALDTFATDWTQKIMQGLGIETQEAKRIRLQEEAQERAAKRIAKAHEDGGTVVAKEIEKGGKAAAKAIKDAEKGTGAAGQSVSTMTVNATTVYVNGNVVDGGAEGGQPTGLSGWGQMKPGTGERESAFAKAARRKRERAGDDWGEDVTFDDYKPGHINELKEIEVHAQRRDSLYGGDDKTGEKSTTDTIGGIFSKFGTKMKGLFSGDAPFLSKLGNMFGKEGLIGDFSQMFSKVKTDFGGLFQGLLSGIGGMLHGMVGGGSGSGWFNALLTGAFAYFGAGGTFGGGGAETPGIAMNYTGGGNVARLAKSGLYPPLGYATGGIARGPRSGYPALLHGNEAVVPLPNGKDIPVMLRGAGASNNVGMTINISRDDSDSTVESDTQEAELLGEKLRMAVQQILLDEKRAGGMLSPFGVA